MVLSQSSLGYLGVVGCIVLVNIVLSSLKWRILLLSDQINIPLSKLVVSYVIGSFFNVFLPSTIGGHSYRIYDIMRQSGQGVRTAASVFADRLSGFIALTFLSLIASFFVAIKIDQPLLAVVPVVVLAGLLLMLYLVWRRTPVLWLLSLVRLNRIPKLVTFVEIFCNTLVRYTKEPATLVRVMVISFAFQFLLILSVYLMAKGIHASAPFVYFLSFVPLITLMEALPISVYGIGVRDMGYVFFFQYAGISEVHTRSLAIVFLGVTFCCAMLGGLFYLARKFDIQKDKPSAGGEIP